MTTTHTRHARHMQWGMKLYLFPGYKKFRMATVTAAAIGPDDAVLDFGCGVGLLEDFIAPALSGRGMVVGVDIGKELIDTARSRFAPDSKCAFTVIDASGQLPFASGSFDRIVSTLVFHLLTRSQKKIVLNEFRRLLKPGGHLVMTEIGKPTGIYGRWIRFLTLEFWIKLWPYEINSVESFEGRLPGAIREAGFSEVNIVARRRGYIDVLHCAV